MKKYKARKSFVASTGKKYFKNDVIRSTEYENLSFSDKINFFSFSDVQTGSDTFSVLESGVGGISDVYIAAPSDFEVNDPDPTPDTNDFQDFDGGDTGGGGASGDW